MSNARADNEHPNRAAMRAQASREARSGGPLHVAGPKSWQPGDRVIVRLPDRSLPHGQGGAIRQADVHGTVREVDIPGQPPGVKVDLDREVNGVRDCYATHRELRPEARITGSPATG